MMEAPTPRTRYERHLTNTISGVGSEETSARERSDSTTFGDPNRDGATNAEVPKPPPGSGLTAACSLVKQILDQVALHDCPTDNETEGVGVVGVGGTTRTMSPPRNQGRKHRASSGGGAKEQGFSR